MSRFYVEELEHDVADLYSGISDEAIMDQQEQIARIGRAQDELRKSVTEQPDFPCDAFIGPLAATSGMIAGAALFGAGMAFAKVFGG
ncbi:hypothetical protein [Bradyrhizobium sp. SZCCHNPS2010]|uniref:hypothetical protein n=1 Tax=Bradyrhizobium sp. SZCCHNPS2010 TaxID=3057333 RepID=UPI002916407E|nr:hypothetical protein [Bradyrhizobium sp. SZCCHNPS2010]